MHQWIASAPPLKWIKRPSACVYPTTHVVLEVFNLQSVVVTCWQWHFWAFLYGHETKKEIRSRRCITYLVECCNPFMLHTTLFPPDPTNWHTAIFRGPPQDFCGTGYWAHIFVFRNMLWHGCVIGGSVGFHAGLFPCPLHGELSCCSTALLVGRRRYCVRLIREWEDLNPSGLGAAELKIAREDLKIRLPRLCNAHSSASL